MGPRSLPGLCAPPGQGQETPRRRNSKAGAGSSQLLSYRHPEERNFKCALETGEPQPWELTALPHGDAYQIQ